jgi:hypothetical protein
MSKCDDSVWRKSRTSFPTEHPIGITTTKGGCMKVLKRLILFISLSLCIACSPEKKRENEAKVEPTINIDQKKFEAVNRAAKSMEASITVGVNYLKFQQLVQDLATEVLIAKDKVSSQDEKKLLGIYSEVVATYQDSAMLWNRKIEGPSREEGGTLYIILDQDNDQEVSLVAEKYNLATTTSNTGTWKMIPTDASMKAIWAAAHDELEEANTILHGKKS